MTNCPPAYLDILSVHPACILTSDSSNEFTVYTALWQMLNLYYTVNCIGVHCLSTNNWHLTWSRTGLSLYPLRIKELLCAWCIIVPFSPLLQLSGGRWDHYTTSLTASHPATSPSPSPTGASALFLLPLVLLLKSLVGLLQLEVILFLILIILDSGRNGCRIVL